MEEQPPETHNLGLVMAILAWILVLLFLTLFFNQWFSIDKAAIKPQVVTTDGHQETHIKRNANNQYIVEGRINDTPVTFLLDTGSTDIVIPGHIAKQLHLTHDGFQQYAHTAGGKVIVYQTHLDKVVIGHITLLNLNASVNPNMGGEEVLLGMSALKQFNFYQKGDSLVLTGNTSNQ